MGRDRPGFRRPVRPWPRVRRPASRARTGGPSVDRHGRPVRGGSGRPGPGDERPGFGPEAPRRARRAVRRTSAATIALADPGAGAAASVAAPTAGPAARPRAGRGDRPVARPPADHRSMPPARPTLHRPASGRAARSRRRRATPRESRWVPRWSRARRSGLLGEDEELVAGRHPVEEAFIARRKAIRLLVVPQRRQALEKLVLHATNLRIPIVEVEGGTLTSLAGFDGHQGIALVTDKRRFAGLDDLLARAIERGEPPFVLVLDSLEDPQNFGSLLRTAEAVGAHGVIYPTHRQAPLSPAAVKASAGRGRASAARTRGRPRRGADRPPRPRPPDRRARTLTRRSPLARPTCAGRWRWSSAARVRASVRPSAAAATPSSGSR